MTPPASWPEKTKERVPIRFHWSQLDQMAQQQHYPMSGDTSTASWPTHLTPSETRETPSVAMLDVSQLGREDSDMSDFPLNGLGFTEGQWPETPLAFQQQYMEEAPYQHGACQNAWPANDLEQTAFQYAPSTLSQPGHAAHPALDDIDGARDASFYFDQTQRMDVDAQLTAFDETFSPERQLSPAAHADGMPRYIPPWSPELLTYAQLERSPGAQELLYAPAADLHPRNPLVGNVNEPSPAGGIAEEPDRNDSSGLDTQLVDVGSPEHNIDPPPLPDPVGPPSPVVDRKSSLSRKTPKARKAGRRHEPLNSHSRHNAKIIRQGHGQCWSCALQRNQCQFENDSDTVCIGCKKKRMASLITGCICVRLPDLTRYFIPASLAEMHDAKNLWSFAAARISRWLKNEFEVCVTWGHGFRPIKVEVTEIEPKGTSLLSQNQYRLNLTTKKYDLVQVPSPPIGIQFMYVGEWRARLDGYLEEILRDSFSRFPAVCFRGDDSRAARDLLVAIFDYHEAASGREKQLVHQALKLVLLTFIMSHSLTIVEDTRDAVYRQLKQRPDNPFGHHTCARWLNKQIKFLLSTLHQDVLKGVLSKLQDTLRKANSKEHWASLFASLAIVAMTTESQEVTVLCKEETDKQEGTIGPDDRTAEKDIAQMDETFDLLRRLFHQKFRTLLPKGLNPLRDLTDRDGLPDHASRSLAAKGNEVLEQYHTFLVARKVLQPPVKTSDPQTGRLLAQFLLCFSPPVEQNQPQPAVPAKRAFDDSDI
ncbi:MAG: hypothetical protein Q9168_001253 [Polycauliona sp. 1 TL-2023]